MFEGGERYGGWLKKKEKKHKGIQDSKFLNWSRKWLKWKVIDQGGSIFHVPSLEHS
jgi:hypothetical protein